MRVIACGHVLLLESWSPFVTLAHAAPATQRAAAQAPSAILAATCKGHHDRLPALPAPPASGRRAFRCRIELVRRIPRPACGRQAPREYARRRNRAGPLP
ncbi:hypothetical protein RR42_m0939 [Cupriavidus basilensis]|uniref:Uncharacterized protein n=1 Tax=Cupriavidus basilensis TaxID=68895 RepID=A0A0C4Y5S3_9BURK|nr:hypothetical protein RR42_m0939 [Cupriavidus basilensis]